MKKVNGFIIEGADQQGKSTICQYIHDKLGWKIKHFPPPASDFDFFNDYLVDDKTISDRNFLSEITYRLMLREKVRVERYEELDQIFNERGFVMLILDRPGEIIDRPEKYTVDQILNVKNIYGKIWSFFKMETHYIDPETEKHIIDNLIKRAL